MPRDVARNPLYSGRINLWVEDAITRAYLSELWNDQSVNILVGGGNEGIGAIVKNAEESGYKNVFGLIDRDFGRSNRDDWDVPGRKFRRFVLPRHEIENYLLDGSALASYPSRIPKRTTDEIEDRLADEAKKCCWWWACRKTVATIRERFFADFLTHPKLGEVPDEVSAKKYIIKSDWICRLPESVAITTKLDVEDLLTESYRQARNHLPTGGWRSEFPGKEILKSLGGWLVNPNQHPRKGQSSAEFEGDLARAVARWQVQNQAVPNDLSVLRVAFEERIAPPSLGEWPEPAPKEQDSQQPKSLGPDAPPDKIQE